MPGNYESLVNDLIQRYAGQETQLELVKGDVVNLTSVVSEMERTGEKRHNTLKRSLDNVENQLESMDNRIKGVTNQLRDISVLMAQLAANLPPLPSHVATSAGDQSVETPSNGSQQQSPVATVTSDRGGSFVESEVEFCPVSATSTASVPSRHTFGHRRDSDDY